MAVLVAMLPIAIASSFPMCCAKDILGWKSLALDWGLTDLSYYAALESFFNAVAVISAVIYIIGSTCCVLVLIFSLIAALITRKLNYSTIIPSAIGTLLMLLSILLDSQVICLICVIAFGSFFIVALTNAIIKRKPIDSKILIAGAGALITFLPIAALIYSATGPLRSAVPRSAVRFDPDYLAEKDISGLVGNYYSGEINGVSHSLNLKPDHTFARNDDSRTGTFSASTGTYRYNMQGTVFLITDHKLKHFVPLGNQVELEKVDLDHQFTTIMRPIVWGERTYLIQPHRMIDFYIAANQKQEPRNHSQGDFYLKEKDWEKTTTGLPDRPPFWTKLQFSIHS